MIQESFRWILERHEAAGERPVPAFEVPELAIFVNAYWLNICGALDNLAWMLQHEHDILPGIGEDSTKRMRIGLFADEFSRKLSDRFSPLADILSQQREWHSGLRELRDPAAHRIPPYPVPGVLEPHHAEEAKRLYAEADALIQSGRVDEGMELLHEGYNVGVYQPLLFISRPNESQMFHLLPLAIRDGSSFITVANAVSASVAGR